ncbi:hypothetical protein TNCV_3089281 [Trichonephila clavipes]|nr:hypothetical protein TNCV_3089281 [Trichonephila clavipes]
MYYTGVDGVIRYCEEEMPKIGFSLSDQALGCRVQVHVPSNQKLKGRERVPTKMFRDRLESIWRSTRPAKDPREKGEKNPD